MDTSFRENQNKNPLSLGTLLPSVIGIGILFGLGLLFTRVFREDILATLAGHAYLGILVFVSTTALAVVLPFWSNLPLIPVATLLYGPLATTGLLILGWTIGSVVSFAFARGYQHWMIRRFPTLSRYAFVDSLVHPRHPFLSLVILRMTLPVDILSYALGCFSLRVSPRMNLFSTLVGIAPFSFVFGYFGALSPETQVLVSVLAAAGFLTYYFMFLKRMRGNIDKREKIQ